jgi:hypothetical protein
MILLVIAGEELSWGQRIFNLPDIGGLRKINYQSELNFHNLVSIHGSLSPLYDIVTYLIIFWILLGALLSFRMENLYERLVNWGIPLIPVYLASVFVLVSVFWNFRPTAKSDEIGEMFLGIAICMWAVDLVLSKSSIKKPRRLTVVAIVLGVFSVNIAAACSLSIWHANHISLKSRLSTMASRDYPVRGMFPQSEKIFKYLYTQPKYLYPYTRIDHCLVCIQAGNAEHASKIVTAASREMEFNDLSESERIKYLRKLSVAYKRLGLNESAYNAFNESLKIARQLADKASDPNRKARYILSSAKTLNSWGDEEGARSEVNSALALSIVPAMRFVLEQYLQQIGTTKHL